MALLKKYKLSSESNCENVHLLKCKNELSEDKDSLEKSYGLEESVLSENINEITEDDSTPSENDLFYRPLDNKVDINKTLLKRENKSTGESWVCSFCKKELNCEDQFRNHQCSEVQNCETNILKERIKTDVIGQVKNPRGRKPLLSVTCEVCGDLFNYVKQLLSHCHSVHSLDSKDVKPYSCTKCENRFSTLTNLNQHLKYHEETRSKICSICGKAFKTASDLTVHEYIHLNRRNYKCDDCNKAFNTNKNLRTHILVVHTDRSLWKYHCTVCGKRFPLKANYDQHSRRHKGEKSHVCQFCGKPFISNSELKRHIELHSNIKRHKCVLCNKEYKTQRSYKAHFNNKHLDSQNKTSTREKKFVCHICPSQFYDKSKLLRHLCSHSGLKPFCCTICGKKFTDKSYLKHHLKVAHNFIDQLDSINL